MKKLFLYLLLLLPFVGSAQFYNGLQQKFGKNRVQFTDFVWKQYSFKKYDVYFYQEGRDNAIYTAQIANEVLKDLEQSFEFEMDDKVYFLCYNKIDHYRQSNIGLSEEEGDLGGITNIIGSKIFVYNEGDHAKLEAQIRAGLTRIMINKMMYGTNWKELIKNSTLLTVPEWYIEGLVSFSAKSWTPEIDSRVRDGIMSGRYNQFNHLTGIDAVYGGHLLWNYIAEVYGAHVIPNILYMSRISRNVESGFLFVLGMGLNNLTEESIGFYRKNYMLEEEVTDQFGEGNMRVRPRKGRSQSKVSVSPDGNTVAMSTNQMGQQKIWLYDVAKRRKKKVFRAHHKLERINDESYPLLSWSPSGDMLAWITERKGAIWLTLYVVETQEKITKEVFNLDKILAFNFSPNGKEMVFSAIRDGKTDLYLYTVSSNSQNRLTYDIYDDMDPSFLDEDHVLFTSNRENDTLRNVDLVEHVPARKDIYLLDLKSDENVVMNLTKTPEIDENLPRKYDDKYFSYLSEKSGLNNRYLAYFDSAVSHVDTTIHYRHFTVSKPVTNYNRSIDTYDVNAKAGKVADVVFFDGRDRVSLMDVNPDRDLTGTILKTEYQIKRDKQLTMTNAKVDTVNAITTEPVIVVEDDEEEEVDENQINIDDYTFDFEKDEKSTKKEEKKPTPPKSEEGHTLTIAAFEEEDEPFVLPNQKDYHLNFTASDLQTRVDFNFSSEMYQMYNSQNYLVTPGMGLEAAVELMDIFEDYKIEGGVRVSANTDVVEYFAEYEDRSKRLDKTYSISRRVVDNSPRSYAQTVSIGPMTFRAPRVSSEQYSYKIISYEGQYKIKWAFNEVWSFRSGARLRNDEMVVLGTTRPYLEAENNGVTWGGLKAAFVFDNTLKKGINLYNGTRFKIFGEHYNFLGFSSSNVNILGIDFRNYLKIHRNIIWANRLAASTSLGGGKLLYVLGAVDNWIVFTDTPKYDDSTPVATDQNFILQASATNMRGFRQNVRNGNNFAVLNSEIRIPVFKYFVNRPIKSDFLSNFQVILFGDVGTAWTGLDPYSDANSFNTREIIEGPLKITIKNQVDPIIGSYGFGVRSRLWGYFAKLDFAWGREDGKRASFMPHFSIGLDF